MFLELCLWTAKLTLLQKVVGANPWVIHRNREVYGEDVEDFRPDRWLKEDTGDMRKSTRGSKW